MKSLFYTKTFIALAVAVATAASVSLVQAQSDPPPAATGLPAGILPGTSLAEVVKLVQSGVDAAVVKSYIANAPGTFNLDADKIIVLTDMGVTSDIINAMMDHDRIVPAAAPAPAPVPVNNAVPDTSADIAPPVADVTVNYFYDTLTPYGSWVDVEGYGRCWRPTVVMYDTGWRPYGDRGHWVNSDCGWYWDSDYSWGITFHYGRWFHHDRFGWCWWPDTVWAPSWVTWRSSDEYCGWAPLPPFAEFRPGFGFFYRGASVAVGFDFGLSADFFMFVPPGHFCDRQPRTFFVERSRVPEIFHRTTIINNYDVHEKFLVNHGIPAQRLGELTHRPLPPVAIRELPNAARQGWRGEPARGPGPGSRDSHPTDVRPNRGMPNTGNSHPSQLGQPAATPNRNEHSPANPPGGQNENRGGGVDRNSHTFNAPAQPVGNQPVNNHPLNPPGNGATTVHAPAQYIPPVQHSTPPVESRPYVAPAAPPMRDNPAVAAPHNVPSPQPQAPPQGQSRGGSDRGGNKDPQNH